LISAILGSAPVPVPPHVFALDGERLRYAAFERSNGGAELRDYRAVDLAPDTFLPGQLGGSLREASLLGQAIEQLLGHFEGAVTEGSLVVPDGWARIGFAETGDLPRSARARDEVLRWKLRRLVPYRVEDLRVRYLEVPALSGQEEPHRVLCFFLLDALFRQIEDAFAARGVRLGSVSNETLSLLEAVGGALVNLDLAGVVHRTNYGYSLVFTREGRPVIYRHKSIGRSATAGDPAVQIQRDLRLTRKYLQDHVEGALLRRILIAAPDDETEPWARWLQEIFEVPVTPVSAGPLDAGLAGAGGSAVGGALPTEEVAPLAGAACRNR
jgi:hypothetical protein